MMEYERKEIVEIFELLELYINDKKRANYIKIDLHKIKNQMHTDLHFILSKNGLNVKYKDNVIKEVIMDVENFIEYKKDRLEVVNLLQL